MGRRAVGEVGAGPVLGAGGAGLGRDGRIRGGGIRGAAIIAAVCSAIAAVITVHFLTRWFKSRNLIPFGVYCVIFGAAMIAYNA